MKICRFYNEIEALGDYTCYRNKRKLSDGRLNDLTKVSRIESVKKDETLRKEESIFNELQENLEKPLEDLSAIGYGESVRNLIVTSSSSNAVDFGLNCGLDSLFLDGLFDADEDSCPAKLFKIDQVFDLSCEEQFVEDKLGVNVCDFEYCLTDNSLIRIFNKAEIEVRSFDSGSEIGSLNNYLIIAGRLNQLYFRFGNLRN